MPTPLFKRITPIVCLPIILLLFFNSAFAAEPINTLEKSGLFSYKPSGIAIRGTDTVAYFTEGKAVAGSDAFTTEWRGAAWKFASHEHLDLFVANPEKYAPQFGGYCAYGVTKNSLVKIEPENWRIVDDKLYLNYNDSIQKTWEKDIQGYIKDAQTKFSALLK
jgi:YHS domain-containing protein